MIKRFYYLKYLCEKNRIFLTYEDPETEQGYKEAVKDLEETLLKKGLIRVNPENGHIMILGGTKGGRKNGKCITSHRNEGIPHKKILSVHGPVYVARSVRG